MTYDTKDATDTESVARESVAPSARDPHVPDGEPGFDPQELRRLTAAARFVLFDFDGPLCRLFAGHTAERVAAGLRGWLKERGLRESLPREAPDSLDPQAILRAVDLGHPGSELVARLEERLTQEELRATVTAMPTAYADPLVRTWRAVGARLAVVTNNSPLAVRGYLQNRGLLDCFDPHIYGRTGEVHLLKPHPDSLSRALAALGADPAATLMIGDSATDLAAAEEAGVPFLGHARHEVKRNELRAAGAETVVESLEPVLAILRGREPFRR